MILPLSRSAIKVVLRALARCLSRKRDSTSMVMSFFFGGRAAEEVDAPIDRNAQIENGVAGVGVDRGFGNGQRPGDPGLLVAGQLPDVDVGSGIVRAHQMRPYVEEFAMAHT